MDRGMFVRGMILWNLVSGGGVQIARQKLTGATPVPLNLSCHFVGFVIS